MASGALAKWGVEEGIGSRSLGESGGIEARVWPPTSDPTFPLTGLRVVEADLEDSGDLRVPWEG